MTYESQLTNDNISYADQVATASHAAIDTLYHRVKSALCSHPNVPDRVLRFEAANGRVVLQGRVYSYFQKQMAQEALRSVQGIEQIDNQLEVEWAK
jgi:osmotically-inducible protein OsmY